MKCASPGLIECVPRDFTPAFVMKGDGLAQISTLLVTPCQITRANHIWSFLCPSAKCYKIISSVASCDTLLLRRWILFLGGKSLCFGKVGFPLCSYPLGNASGKDVYIQITSQTQAHTPTNMDTQVLDDSSESS